MKRTGASRTPHLNASVGDLTACAAKHLADYIDEAGLRSFHAYDVQGNPGQLDPCDLLAPALLDAPVRGAHVIAMHQPSGPYRLLRDALQAVLDDTAAGTSGFTGQVESTSPRWAICCRS